MTVIGWAMERRDAMGGPAAAREIPLTPALSPRG